MLLEGSKIINSINRYWRIWWFDIFYTGFTDSVRGSRPAHE